MQETLILVDNEDRQVGVAEKMAVHREGTLHRAFSVFIFDSEGNVLMQRRARGKYHSGGLLTNTCCGHPRAGEGVHAAAKRRLFEEVGVVCELEEVGSFIYRVHFENGMNEHEYDHVLIGEYNGKLILDRNEIEECLWMDQKKLRADIRRNSERYTYWMHQALGVALKGYHKKRLANTLKKAFFGVTLDIQTSLW